MSERDTPTTPHRESIVGVVYARPMVSAHPRTYPESEMTRASATLDIAVALALFFGMFAAPWIGSLTHAMADRWPEFGILWSNVVIGLGSMLIVAGILICRRQGPSTLGLGRFDVRALLGTIAAVPGCYFAMFATGIAYLAFMLLFSGEGVDTMLADKQDLIDAIPNFSIVTMLLFGVLTGIHEELLFRGLLLTRCNAIVRNKGIAILISGVIFGLVHSYQGPMGMVQTGAIGLVLGTIATLSRSLWPAIIGHAIFNSLQLAIFPLLRPFIEQVTSQPTTLPGG